MSPPVFSTPTSSSRNSAEKMVVSRSREKVRNGGPLSLLKRPDLQWDE
jgi:hypothetical protein